MTSENDMVECAVSWLRARLPENWDVGPTARAEFQAGEDRVDAAIDVRGPNGTFTTMVVEVKRVFGPRDAERLLPGVGKTLRTLSSHIPILVIAPWLSHKTQELLTVDGINYLDLTGNALIRLDNPTLYVETQGASKDPSPPARNKARVQGAKAGRLIRVLVDVRPPYGVRELAASAELAFSYVSRILDTLDDEALFERFERGRVKTVDVGGLIRRWVETYDVFRANKAQRYLAPAGAASALEQLRVVSTRTAVTGSFAASRLAPVAAPALLAVYTDDPRTVAEALGLIPADQGANITILMPFDPVVWERTSVVDGVTYVAPSQAAADCLTGNGRMPAEGDAVLQWMIESESMWRLDKLPETAPNG
ncbi:MAG: type IV toxin-antitoxin system AbiEi family antitoxin [Acidimicrobiales bacterium]